VLHVDPPLDDTYTVGQLFTPKDKISCHKYLAKGDAIALLIPPAIIVFVATLKAKSGCKVGFVVLLAVAEMGTFAQYLVAFNSFFVAYVLVITLPSASYEALVAYATVSFLFVPPTVIEI
jgi:hypothetical protein